MFHEIDILRIIRCSGIEKGLSNPLKTITNKYSYLERSFWS